MKTKEFYFVGMENPCNLENPYVPHPPHVVGTYHTYNYGMLEEYCCGVKPAQFVIEDFEIHTARDPGHLSGYTWEEEES